MSGADTFDSIKLLDVHASQLVIQSSSLAITSFSNADGELKVLQPAAAWRQQPAGDAQISFVGAMIGASYQRGAIVPLETNVPGRWIGRVKSARPRREDDGWTIT